ncbi:MAG TPA: hypothetical protein VMU66_07605 [Gaiellales bacterium]|nr:hypothetical protein [Gaiellales bacterium]
MGSITNARSDPWRCASCGARADLAGLSAPIGLVRLAATGEPGFRLGSTGIESEIAALLLPCACGGSFEPGAGSGERSSAAFDLERLRPLAERGWAVLEGTADRRLTGLREIWRAPALVACGREQELDREELLRMRLEHRLADLMEQVARARELGDEDAADAAQARYVELGTTYMRRFVVRSGDA